MEPKSSPSPSLPSKKKQGGPGRRHPSKGPGWGGPAKGQLHGEGWGGPAKGAGKPIVPMKKGENGKIRSGMTREEWKKHLESKLAHAGEMLDIYTTVARDVSAPPMARITGAEKFLKAVGAVTDKTEVTGADGGALVIKVVKFGDQPSE